MYYLVMKRYYIIYEGIVQGVGFRWRLMTVANKYNLTGFCRNLSNGNVECEVQGNDVDEFVKETIKSERFVKVYDYSIKEIPVDEQERIFDVRF